MLWAFTDVVASNYTDTAGALKCWIDFNRNGIFGDAGEASGVAAVSAQSGSQTYPLSFSGFAPLTAGTTFIRCRAAHSASEVDLPVNTAYSGEIEDHRVVIN